MVKVVISDLDGTLIAHDNVFTDRAKNVVARLRKQGIQFVGCTGRSKRDLRSCIPPKLFSSTIILNGACILDENDQCFLKHAMSAEKVWEISDSFQEYELPVILYGEENIYLKDDKRRIEECCRKFFQGTDTVFYPNSILLQKQEYPKEDIYKVETLTADLDQRQQWLDKFSSRKDCSVTSSIHCNIEVTRKDVNKAEMIQEYLKLNQISENEMIYFGDSHNDLSVFLKFKNTIAVKDAPECVLTNALAVVDSCENEGVLNFIEEKLLR